MGWVVGTIEEILEQAGRLPPGEREKLVDRLIAERGRQDDPRRDDGWGATEMLAAMARAAASAPAAEENCSLASSTAAAAAVASDTASQPQPPMSSLLAGLPPPSQWHRPGSGSAHGERGRHRLREPRLLPEFVARCPSCQRSLHRSRSQNLLESALKLFLPLKTYRCPQCQWRGWQWIGWRCKLHSPRQLTRMSLLFLVVFAAGVAIAAYCSVRAPAMLEVENAEGSAE